MGQVEYSNMKYLSPWKKINDNCGVFLLGRKEPFVRIITSRFPALYLNAAYIEYKTDGMFELHHDPMNAVFKYNTLEETKQFVEDILTDLGYQFLDIDDYEKLELLI